MHLHHDSLAFLPLASRFMTFWLGHAHKPKFWDLRLKAFRFLEFFLPFLFLLFFPFCCSDWPSNGLACSEKVKKTSKKASRRSIFTMEHPGATAGNFGLSFSLQVFEHFCAYLRLHSANHSDLGITGKIFSSCRSWAWMMPILVKSDDVRSGRNA